jgi:hypothetical protein
MVVVVVDEGWWWCRRWVEAVVRLFKSWVGIEVDDMVVAFRGGCDGSQEGGSY